MAAFAPTVSWRNGGCEMKVASHRSLDSLLPSRAQPPRRSAACPLLPSACLLQHEKQWSHAPSNTSICTRGHHGVRCRSGPQLAGPCDSMAEVYALLTERLLKLAEQVPTGQKYMVALAGPPGSGKSTVAKTVVDQVNATWRVVNGVTAKQGPGGIQGSADVAAVVPMDGFHLYKWQLDCFEGCGYVPSFDHGVGDPTERAIFIHPEVRVVVVEGLYLLLQEKGWREVQDLFDEKWFISVDLEEAMRRVEKRHVATGKPPHIANWRISKNDRPNAEIVMKTKENADLIFRSLPL